MAARVATKGEEHSAHAEPFAVVRPPCQLRSCRTGDHLPKRLSHCRELRISRQPKAEDHSVRKHADVRTCFAELTDYSTLVPEHLSEDYLEFIHSNGIRHVQIHIPANKDGVIHITPERMCMALSVVLERKNHPILIHCNRGKHRTGCVTACLRKIQSLSDEAAISEYRDYSYPKCRPDDVAFIRSFNPMALYPYAQAKGWTVTPPPEPSDDDWHLKQEPMVFSLSDIAALKVPEEPDSSL